MSMFAAYTENSDAYRAAREAAGNADAVFFFSRNGNLTRRPDGWADKVTAFLAWQVSRKPSNLRSHVQRIELHIELNDAEGVYGALLDLYIAVGEQGRSLKERLLEKARPILNDKRFEVLNGRLNTGINATDPLFLSPNCMLSKGLIGTNNLIGAEDNNRDKELAADPRDEAQTYLEYGQIEEAQALLEQALNFQPWRKDIYADLVEIYKATRDKSRHLNTVLKLEENGYDYASGTIEVN